MKVLSSTYNEDETFYWRWTILETILFQAEARKKLLHGAEILMKSVKGTLGPCGHHVMMERAFGKAVITNDGVSIAKSLYLDDPYEKMGAQLLLESALKTNEIAGDGTTTCILLAYELVKRGYDYIAKGGNVSLFAHAMQETSQHICTYLKEHSHKIDTYDEVRHVAQISAKDETLGTLVADAISLVDDPHCVICESGKSFVSKVRLLEGMEVDTTCLSPYFFTKDEKKITLKNPLLLVSNESVEDIKQIETYLLYALEQHRPFILLCAGMESDVLAPLVLAHMQKKGSVIVLRAPSFGTYQQEILDDIALLTNGKPCFQELGTSLGSMDITCLGECKECVITPHSMHLFAQKHRAVEERIESLKKQLSSYSQSYDIQHTYRRITRLEGKLASIEVGGYTPQEIEEKKYRCEDAMQAAFAAMEDGVVAGGGLSYIQAYQALHVALKGATEEEEAGIACVLSAILKPFLQLMENSYENPTTMLQKQFEQEYTIGYNVQSKAWCNMEAAGIVDPLKVVTYSLQHALSIALLFIRCDVALLQQRNPINN